jgi:HlyD family secretion protein
VSSILNLGANATLVMTLGDIQKVFVRGKVDEADIGRVRLGQAAKITTESFPRARLRGSRHADFPDRGREGQRHHVRGEGLDRQRHKELKANMTANAEIVLEQFPDSLLVPEAAVVFDASASRSSILWTRVPKPGAVACPSPSASATAPGCRFATA